MLRANWSSLVLQGLWRLKTRTRGTHSTHWWRGSLWLDNVGLRLWRCNVSGRCFLLFSRFIHWVEYSRSVSGIYLLLILLLDGHCHWRRWSSDEWLVRIWRAGCYEILVILGSIEVLSWNSRRVTILLIRIIDLLSFPCRYFVCLTIAKTVSKSKLRSMCILSHSPRLTALSLMDLVLLKLILLDRFLFILLNGSNFLLCLLTSSRLLNASGSSMGYFILRDCSCKLRHLNSNLFNGVGKSRSNELLGQHSS